MAPMPPTLGAPRPSRGSCLSFKSEALGLGSRVVAGGDCGARRVAGGVSTPPAMIRPPMMNRRGFLQTLSVSLLAAPRAAEAQSASKVYRAGILAEKALDPSEARLWQAFRLGLRELGWIEGKNILIENRWVEGNYARIPELAAD